MYYGNNDWKSGCLYALMMIGISLVITFLFCFVFAYVAMVLWNYAVTTMFALPCVDFWHMFAFLVLVKIMFSMNISFNNNKKD